VDLLGAVSVEDPQLVIVCRLHARMSRRPCFFLVKDQNGSSIVCCDLSPLLRYECFEAFMDPTRQPIDQPLPLARGGFVTTDHRSDLTS